MTKKQIITEIKNIIARDDIDNRIEIWLNLAIDDISLLCLRNLLSTQNYSQNTTELTLPSDFQNLYSLRIIDERPLEYITLLEYDNFIATGYKQKPNKYTFIGNNKIGIVPIPDKIYNLQMRYYKVLDYDIDKWTVQGLDNILIAMTVLKGLQALDDGSETNNTLIKNWGIRLSMALRPYMDVTQDIPSNATRKRGGYLGEYWRDPFTS